MSCEDYLPIFEKALVKYATSQAFDRYNGLIFLPIQKGCYPQIQERLKQYNIRSSSANPAHSLKCECISLSAQDNHLFLSPNSFDARVCAKLAEEQNNI